MEGREAELWGGREEGQLRRGICSLLWTGQTLAVRDSAGRAREASSTLLAPSLPSRRRRGWAQCPSDSQQSRLLSDCFAVTFSYVLPQFLLPAWRRPPGSLPGSPRAAAVPGRAGVPRWRCTWVLRCWQQRLSCVAGWVSCGRSIKPHSSVETFPANHRARQGLISALWPGCRACPSAQPLLRVTSGWAVKTSYKRVLAREPAVFSAVFRCTWELYLLCVISLIKIRIRSLCYIPINDRAGIWMIYMVLIVLAKHRSVNMYK